MARQFGLEHVDLICGLAGDAVFGKPDDYSKAGWVKYFWDEAKAFPDQWRRDPFALLAVLNAGFILPEQWDWDKPTFDKANYRWDGKPGEGRLVGRQGPPPIRFLPREGQGQAFDAVPTVLLRPFLNRCLEIGFTRIDVNEDTGGIADSSLEFANHNIMLDEKTKFQIGWRGDSRTPEQTEAAGGLATKADSEGFAQSKNMREPWHPFSNAEVRRHYWFRRKRSDNCLHAAVSVALNFETASSFPMREHELNPFLDRKFPTNAKEKASLEAEYGFKFATINLTTPKGTKNIYRFADQNTLFMVLLSDNIFNTKKKQELEGEEKFPEVGVKAIPPKQIMAILKYVRVFRGMSYVDGFRALYVHNGSKMLRHIPSCTSLAGDPQRGVNLFRQVQQQYWSVTKSMPLDARWEASGGVKVSLRWIVDGEPVIRINRVTDGSGKVIWPA